MDGQLPKKSFPVPRPQATITCDRHTTARKALQCMLDNHVRCIGLTTDNEKLCGLLSLSDIRWLAEGENPEIKALDMSAEDFVRASRHAQGNREVNALVTCAANTHAGDILRLMVENSVQQIFVVENGSTNGVISSHELIRILV